MQQIYDDQPPSLFSTQLSIFYIFSLLFGITLGLFNPLISTFMEEQKISQLWIGLTSTIYFIAIALGTPLIERLFKKLGIRYVLLLGLLCIGFSAPLFPLTSQLFLWCILRILMGFGVGCLLIGGQTGLVYFAHHNHRTKVSGFYFLAMGLGFIIGAILGSRLYNISPKIAFSIGGIIVMIAFVLISYFLKGKLTISKSASSNPKFKQLLKQFTFPIHGIFAYGMANATLITLYPVFLLTNNYSVEQMGLTLSIFFVGNLLSTVPVTNLADHLGKIKVLFLCISVGIISLTLLIFVHSYSLILLFAGLTGASIGPIHALCLALVGEQVSREHLGAGTALLTATYSLGNIAGPILAALLMELFGNRFIFGAFIPLSLILLLRIKYRNKILKHGEN